MSGEEPCGRPKSVVCGECWWRTEKRWKLRRGDEKDWGKWWLGSSPEWEAWREAVLVKVCSAQGRRLCPLEQKAKDLIAVEQVLLSPPGGFQ